MVSDAEAKLLARCRRGEPAAWDELFEVHYAAAGRFIFQLDPEVTREDAEELCQEVFLTVIKSLNSFKEGCQFQTWLFRVAVNKTRDFRARRHAAKRGSGQSPLSLNAPEPETGLVLDPPGTTPAPDAQLLAAEQAALVHQALERLGEPCREIIELRYFGDLSYEEISQSLALNPKTVSSRLSKCLDRLEEIMKTVFSGEKTAISPSNL
jgi:RNA polymerase sigma-70 factor, ECF subfamily